MKKPSITLWIKNKTTKKVRKVRTGKQMRITNFLRERKILNSLFRVRVQYTEKENNQTDWQTSKETYEAFRAFMDTDIIKEFCKEEK